jgi:hypothetical protein
MRQLSLSESTINTIVDDPTVLHSAAYSTNGTASLTRDQALYALNNGFTKGFRDLFVLNASLCAGACVASIVMIKHKDLNRKDDEQLKKESKEAHKSAEDVESGATAADTPELSGTVVPSVPKIPSAVGDVDSKDEGIELASIKRDPEAANLSANRDEAPKGNEPAFSS